jgi:hypothetical protein
MGYIARFGRNSSGSPRRLPAAHANPFRCTFATTAKECTHVHILCKSMARGLVLPSGWSAFDPFFGNDECRCPRCRTVAHRRTAHARVEPCC